MVPYGPAEGAPEAPGWLRVTSTQADRADLAWGEPDESGNSPLWGYRIEVSTDGGDNWREVEANTETTSRKWSDAGVDDLANRLYRVSAVNAAYGAGNPTAAASLAAMTLERLSTTPAQHFENEGDERASSHSVTAAVELTNPAPGRRVHVRLLRDGQPAQTREGEVVEAQVLDPAGTSVAATFVDLPGRTTFTVTADVVASFDSPEALWKLAITLGDIRQGEGPGRGVEVDTDGDGVAEADPQLTVAMGAAASIRVRPGACTGAKQVVVHESLTQFGVYRFGPIVAEVSPGGHTWTCADGDDPGAWQPIELTVERHADAMLAAPFEVGVRHDVYAQRPAHQPWQPLVLQGDLVRLEVEASQTLASVTGLAVEADDSDRPRVIWNAVAGAGAYQVQWRWGSEGYGRWHKENGATSSREKRTTETSHTVAVPSAAKRAEGLTVRVRAYDGDALTVGPWREAVLGSKPGQPSGLTATPDSTTAIRLAWEVPASNGASVLGYGIEVSEDGGRNWQTLVQDTGSTAAAYVHRNLAPGSQRFYRVRAHNGAGTGTWSHLAGTSTLRSGQASGALTAQMNGLPERHDGSGAVRFKMAFSEPVTAGEDAVRAHALSVTNGTVSEASQREDEPGAYDMKVMPDSDRDITIVLPGGRPCAETGAICTEDGRQLAHALSMSVPGPATAGGASVLAGFVLVDATAHRDAGAIEDGATLTGIDPGKVYGVRANVVSGAEGLKSVTLTLSGPGPNDEVSQTEGIAPYSLYGDSGGHEHGAALPAGSYTLTATAHSETGGGGSELGALRVGFTVAAGPLTARFEGLPEAGHGGAGTPFTFRVVFSEPIEIGEADFREHGLAVTGGTVTAASRVAGEPGVWSVTIEPASDGTVLVGLASLACTAEGALCTADGRGLAIAPAQSVLGAPPAEPIGMSATYPPSRFASARHLGPDDRPQVVVSFSRPVAPIATTTPSVTLERATLLDVQPHEEDGIDNAWIFILAPSGHEDISFRLRTEVACAEGGICAGDGGLLTSVPGSRRLEGPPLASLTASFEGMPGEHDGVNTFTFRLRFSEAPAVSYTVLRDESFGVSGGTVSKARRVDGRDDLREIHIEPSTVGAVTITLPPTANCDASGAICTSDGRPLSNRNSATVAGPVGISVADARVDEGEGAVLAFAVTLSRAASGTVTVDYATADGSAQAGVDYTEASGTLTFEAGDSSQTVTVTVLDDSHDEGEETLTLLLSNPSTGRLTDGEATGTIKNRDPLPRALLARFGRTAAVHVVEHVEERLAAPRAPGVEGRFAGRELRRGMEREMALDFLRQLGSASGGHPGGMGRHGPMAGSRAAGATPLGTPGLGGGGALMRGAGGPLAGAGGMTGGTASLEMPGRGAAGFGGGAPMAAGPMDGPSRPAGGLNGGGLVRMGLGGGDLLTGSAFAMNRESHGGILSFWSRGAQSRFAGREGALSLGGDVRTTMVGADYAKGPVVAGLSLSHSRGLGEYAGVAGGQVASSVTGLYPWLGYKATERVTVWGVAGYGAGGLRLTPQGGPALEAGLSMAMAAAGTRGELVSGGAGGVALAFKADALWVGTATDGVDGLAGRLAATEAAVTRFRTGLEGSRAYTLAGRLSLTPSVEVGLRHDGGDAETGAGMDVGAGLIVSDASSGLAVDVRVRTLLVHQAEGFRERGVAVSLSYNPTPSTPLGFTARVAPSWGGQATSGAEALWGRETMSGMAQGGLAQGNRFDGEVGYGLPVGSRFVGTPRVGFSTSADGRDYRLGYGLGVLDRESLHVELGVDAQRRESPMLGGTSNGVLGQASLGW